MFLGIPYNKWHGILAFAGIVVLFILFLFFLFPSLAKIAGFGGALLICFLFPLLIVDWLQSRNEAYQAIDPKCEEKYGSYDNFVVNSQDDWHWYYRGGLIGVGFNMIIAFIYFMLAG